MSFLSNRDNFYINNLKWSESLSDGAESILFLEYTSCFV